MFRHFFDTIHVVSTDIEWKLNDQIERVEAPAVLECFIVLVVARTPNKQLENECFKISWQEIKQLGHVC